MSDRLYDAYDVDTDEVADALHELADCVATGEIPLAELTTTTEVEADASLKLTLALSYWASDDALAVHDRLATGLTAEPPADRPHD